MYKHVVLWKLKGSVDGTSKPELAGEIVDYQA